MAEGHPAGDSVLGRLARQGVPIDRLARPADEGRETWCWERDPDARALLKSVARARKPAAGRRDAPRRCGGRTGSYEQPR